MRYPQELVEACPVALTAEARAWLLERETCAMMLHNLDCAASLPTMWLVQRGRPGEACPRWERCVWHGPMFKRWIWSGVVPAGPPTKDFLDSVLAGIREVTADKR